MGKLSFFLAIVLGIGTVGVISHNSNVDCIEVYVDYGPLSHGMKTIKCVPAQSSMPALDVLRISGLSIEGTEEYGDATICRVNGLPDATVEPCLLMPLEEAYWAILIKEHQIIPMPIGTAGAWGWAQTGANDINLKPGDSIGLVFTDNGEVRFP